MNLGPEEEKGWTKTEVWKGIRGRGRDRMIEDGLASGDREL